MTGQDELAAWRLLLNRRKPMMQRVALNKTALLENQNKGRQLYNSIKNCFIFFRAEATQGLRFGIAGVIITYT